MMHQYSVERGTISWRVDANAHAIKIKIGIKISINIRINLDVAFIVFVGRLLVDGGTAC